MADDMESGSERNAGQGPRGPVNVVLSYEDARRLQRLLSLWRSIDGWCRVNRFIGHVLFFGLLAAVILLSNALDAVRNLFGLGHP